VLSRFCSAVIQSTVAVACPVVPSSFSNKKTNVPFSVNIWFAPPVLVIVTPVVENHVTVAVTVPVVPVAGL